MRLLWGHDWPATPTKWWGPTWADPPGVREPPGPPDSGPPDSGPAFKPRRPLPGWPGPAPSGASSALSRQPSARWVSEALEGLWVTPGALSQRVWASLTWRAPILPAHGGVPSAASRLSPRRGWRPDVGALPASLASRRQPGTPEVPVRLSTAARSQEGGGGLQAAPGRFPGTVGTSLPGAGGREGAITGVTVTGETGTPGPVLPGEEDTGCACAQWEGSYTLASILEALRLQCPHCGRMDSRLPSPQWAWSSGCSGQAFRELPPTATSVGGHAMRWSLQVPGPGPLS